MNTHSINRTVIVLLLFSLGSGNLIAVYADDQGQTKTEATVRESFEKQMKLQEARIEKAEADLKRIKEEFEKRLANAEQLIKQHAALLDQKQASIANDESDVPAAVLSAEGWKAWQKQDWREALSKFELAVKKDPSSANTLNGLGWTYLHLGEHDKAIATFEKALKIEPTQGGAINGIGQSLMAQGRLDEAEKKLRVATDAMTDQMGEAMTVKNGATASWFGLVRVLLMKGENDKAIQWADRYLQHKPDDPAMKQMLDQARQAETSK